MIRHLLAAALLSAAPLALAEGDGEITASELLPLEEASWPMRVTEGPGSGGEVEFTLAPAGADGLWAMAVDGRNRVGVQTEEDGTLVVSAVELTDANQRLEFDPPALLVPATMSPGQSFSRSGDVKIFETHAGEVKTTGTYEQTLPPPSRRSFDLPGGEVQAFEVGNTIKVETDWATVDLETTLALSRENGPVHRRLVSNVTKAMMFGEKTTRTIEQRID